MIDDGVVPLLRLVTGKESRHATDTKRKETMRPMCVSCQMDGKDKNVPSSEAAAPGFGGCRQRLVVG